ncbi:MAG: hypothetical protein ACRD3S_09415 [Terracidiphilus sp.]
MKSSTLIGMAVLLFGFFGLFGPSGRSFPLQPGKIVPGATGTVKVSKDTNNGNLKLDIKVKDLALPGSLTPPQNEYIVWLEPYNNKGQPIKQGAIGVDGKEQGELKTETASKNFNVLITAETNEAVTSPSDKVVLR